MKLTVDILVIKKSLTFDWSRRPRVRDINVHLPRKTKECHPRGSLGRFDPFLKEK